MVLPLCLLRLPQKNIVFVLELLTDSLFASNHLLTRSNSSHRVWLMVSESEHLTRMAVSSTYINAEEFTREFIESLSQKMNCSGTRIDPWGTPLSISNESDNISSKHYDCFLFDKYDLNQLRTDCLKPRCFSFSSSTSWFTVSKAFKRSKNIAPQTPPIDLSIYVIEKVDETGGCGMGLSKA